MCFDCCQLYIREHVSRSTGLVDLRRNRRILDVSDNRRRREEKAAPNPVGVRRSVRLHVCGAFENRHLLVLLRRRRGVVQLAQRSEEHTSELQSLMRISYAVFCLKKKTKRRTL